MKPVFQIAGGIVLAFLIIVGVNRAYTQYQLDQLNKAMKQEQAKQTQLSEQRKIQLNNKQRIEVALKQERKRKMQEEQATRLVEKQKTAAAWNKYYIKPENCNRPQSQKEAEWCQRHFLNAKSEFQVLLSKGKVSLE